MSNPPADAIGYLPWHAELRGRIGQAVAESRLHHALLITGLPGVGKGRFADALAQGLLCEHPLAPVTGCGTCRACRWFVAGTHPDLLRVGPDEQSKSGEIKVEQIRRLIDSASLSSQSGRKVVIIAPAERMNGSAANSLLKTLEEPSPSTLILLVSAQPGRVLPTISRRGQQHARRPPAEAQARAGVQGRSAVRDPLPALRQAGGAPLLALQWLARELVERREAALDAFVQLGTGRGDPVATAAAWMNWDLPLLFQWMSGWLADVLRLAQHGGSPRLANPDRVAQMQGLAQAGDLAGMHRLWRRVAAARRGLQANLNAQLLLESLLIEWTELATGGHDHGRTQNGRQPSGHTVSDHQG